MIWKALPSLWDSNAIRVCRLQKRSREGQQQRAPELRASDSSPLSPRPQLFQPAWHSGSQALPQALDDRRQVGSRTASGLAVVRSPEHQNRDHPALLPRPLPSTCTGHRGLFMRTPKDWRTRTSSARARRPMWSTGSQPGVTWTSPLQPKKHNIWKS